MSQVKLNNLVSKLRHNLRERRNLKNPEGPVGRHNKIRKTVSALFKYERIELNYQRGDECRGYAERLISEAIRYGDCHKPTMDVANYWLIEKQLVHKLFKVLAPRYQNYKSAYTKMWKAPTIYPGRGFSRCVLELRGNIFPPLGEDKSYNKNLIHNVLLSEAKKAFEKEKAEKIIKAEITKNKLDDNVESIKSDEQVSKVDNTNNTVTDEKNVQLDVELNKMTLKDSKEEEKSTKEKEV